MGSRVERIRLSRDQRGRWHWEGMMRMDGNDPSGHDCYKHCSCYSVPEYNLIDFPSGDAFLFMDDF